jgi:DNA-binding transcriptional LysR family regulator
MELYQLNTFVKIADEGSLTRAAELLFTSQPAISAQIKALEEELGVALFERKSRGMQLTDKGKLLYGQAVDTLDAAARLKNEALQLQQELVGELKIGVHTDFDFMQIGELHRRMQQQYARVRPHFIQSMSAQILPDIRRGILDAGFFFGHCSPVDLTVFSLGSVPMRIVGPADWADRIHEATLQQLASLPWIYTSDNCPFYTLAQQVFADDAGTVQRVAYVDSEDAVRELVRAGVGLSLLRASDADRLEKAGEATCWRGDTPSINLGFAVHRQRSAEPMINALRTLVDALWDSVLVQGNEAVPQPG